MSHLILTSSYFYAFYFFSFLFFSFLIESGDVLMVRLFLFLYVRRRLL